MHMKLRNPMDVKPALTIESVHSPILREPEAMNSESGMRFELIRFLALLQAFATARPGLLAHGDRTASYALLLGKTLGLSAVDLNHLHYAALLHDIGQLTLPSDVLEKDGPLTADEYELMQSHPRAGSQLLAPVSFLRIPALWIAHHHEHWDGSGYPFGLRGAFIPLGSRILAVTDTFDTLASRPAHGPDPDREPALTLLRIVSGSQLDPEIVEAFVHMAPEPLFERSNGALLHG
jgi:HD-GYP domain-containing protein (c-di-GMP phosphodiesterase class II)